MNKTDKLLEEKLINGFFSFATFSRFKVRVKEVILKHNKELEWSFKEELIRSDKGEKMTEFILKGKVIINDVPEILGMFAGLIEDIYYSLGVLMNEETAISYNENFIGVVFGKELNNHLGINLDPKKIYYFLRAFDSNLILFSDVNSTIELEKTYPKLVESVYGETVQSLYEKNISVLTKTFVRKSELDVARQIIEILEKNSNIKKIPYKLKKFRFERE